MWKKVLPIVSYGLAVTGVICGVGLGVSKVPYPATFWAGRTWLVILLTVIAALLPSLQAGLAKVGERRELRKLELEKQLRPVLVTPLVGAIKDCGGDPTDLSIQVLLVKRPWFGSGATWRHWRGVPRQVGVARLGLSGLTSSGIAWTKNKGVIGLCWERQDEIWEILSDFQILAKTKEEDWTGWKTSKVYNLSYEEARKIGNKYATIAAVPMTDANGNYIGCLSLDSTKPLKHVEAAALRLRHAAEVASGVILNHGK
ncbi:MAG: hypothetical protein EPO35_05000 [Acidobacteria bacterium]|nr:MAG: hypothetical protein EPO35_05000 [Acidobacteriota bacterium]